MPLTDTAIRNAKPREDGKPAKLADGGSLFLWVMPNGAKYWRMAYRFDGKQKTLAFGVYPTTSLKDAREKREAARKLLAAGTDPNAAKKEQKRERQLTVENSFEIVAREWYDKQLPRWTDDHAVRILDSLKADAFPDLGKLPVSQLTAPVILDTIRKIEKRGAVETAQRVLQRISAVIRYAIQTGRAVHNPATDLTGAIRAKKVEHRPALPRGELREFYRRLAAEPLYIPTRIAMHLLMLTFVRPGELRAARWEEFDEERAEWRIPAERMKMREPHLVPLSRQALELLKELRPLTGKSALLFPAVTDLKKPMSENTLGYAMGRMGYKGTATPHGFRALASTVLNEEGFDPDIIEKQLAHAERNKVRAAYHRAEYLEERRKMMQWWAEFLGRHQKSSID
ncbi:tyrosine-type recombinase/integrase [Chromobacterium violaceum]|uniref:Prophage CP4-like integrase n=1 Tax=Chromobacterium violaceum (strain ATCC 12472 / DSM 30191 / JCM 1249 / CCUG 213 / NBRC 12614 / NCIMB 9131 / NCTC 9757 / MK) TaxID=243365 RepID=Q7P0B6_CHRVO|nr:integrase arm-type DNA-binding domain-containing protein [Chromobacterium violaceum]AAQ58327.1 prophage CP4-like integrase [Chromobacterium violaceum ATCC 12472]SUX40092.1 Prophage CP4-57 integrase [Chromobacterium violaceum]